jgi:plasmid stabilization system protein ParE
LVIRSHCDLTSIAGHIAKDSAFYASAFVLDIREASRSLKEFPERGRVVPELSNQNIRGVSRKELEIQKCGGILENGEIPDPVA